MYTAVYGDIAHPRIASVYNNLGNIYYSQAQYDQAIEFFQKSLDMFKKVYANTPHPAIATAYHSLGFVHKANGDMDTAKKFYAEAAAIEKDYAAMTKGK